MSKRRRISLKRMLAYSALVLIFPIAIGELVARTYITLIRGPLLYETDDELGYSLHSDLQVIRSRSNGDCSFQTDPRERRFVPEVSNGNDLSIIVILGDSFAFGEGVNDEETSAAYIAQRGFRVVNLGIQGYGNHQQLLALRRGLQNDRADYVVALAYSNDSDNVLCTYKHMRCRPTASIVQGGIQLDRCSPPISDYLIDWSYLCALARYFSNTPQRRVGERVTIVSACLAAIRTGALWGQSASLFCLYDAKQPGKFPQLMSEFQRRNLNTVDLSPMLLTDGAKVIGPDGIHWNARGHQVATDAILA